MSASMKQSRSPWQACRLFQRASPLPDPGPWPGRTSCSRNTRAPSAWAMAAVSSAEPASMTTISSISRARSRRLRRRPRTMPPTVAPSSRVGRQTETVSPSRSLAARSLAGGSNWLWWKVRLPNHSQVSMSVIPSPVPGPPGIMPPRCCSQAACQGKLTVTTSQFPRRRNQRGGGTGPTKPRQPPPDEEGATSGLATAAREDAPVRFDRPRRDVAPRRAPEVADPMTDQTLEHVILRCRGCRTAYPAALEYACPRCLGPLDPEYDAAAVAARLSREAVEAGPRSIWRYAPLLPASPGPGDLAPGLTPLVP